MLEAQQMPIERDMRAVARDSEGRIRWWFRSRFSVTSGSRAGVCRRYAIRFAECDFLLVFYVDL